MDSRGYDMAMSPEPRVGARLPWGDRRTNRTRPSVGGDELWPPTPDTDRAAAPDPGAAAGNGAGTVPTDESAVTASVVDVTEPRVEPPAAPVQEPPTDLADEVQRLLGEQEQRLAAAVEGRVADLLGDHERRMGARLATVERRSQEAAATVDRAVTRLGAGLEALESVRSDLATRTADLGAQLETLRATISRQLPEVAARQRATLTSMEAVQASLRETVTGLDDALDQGLGSLAAWRDELPAATRRVGAELGRDVDRARERLVEEAGHSTRQLEQAARRAEGLAESLARVEGLFFDRMARWERAGRDERRLVVEEVVGLLAEQLPARHRRRIAEDLLARSREADANPPTGGSGEVHASELVPSRPEPATLPAEPVADTAPPPAPVVEPAPQPPAEEAPSDLDEVLEAIPGVGPARRQLLAEAFGDLDALREATVDQIEDLPGITRELAQRIHDHLRG